MEENNEIIELLSPEETIPEFDTLVKMIDEKRYSEFIAAVSEITAVDLAEIFTEIPEEYNNRFFRLLPKEKAADVFVELDGELQEYIINSFSDNRLSEMLDELYIDDTVDMIEEMPANVVKRILRISTPENRDIINQLLRYPKDSAGTIMTTEYVRFTKSMTVEDALTHIRRVAIDKETIYTCYVTDSDKHLIGLVTAKQLMLSEPETLLEDIMEESVIFAVTTDDREEVALKFNKYGFIALPVVDKENRLVGIVTVDDAIDVIKEETEEDFAKMAAITPTETPYLRTSAFKIWRSRVVWLLLLMISATFSSTILNRFEAALPAVLILFVPMLMDTGGNSGGQTSVTITRSISLGEVEFKDLLSVLWKELRVGIFCGLTLGVVSFAKVMLVDRLLMGNNDVTLTVAVTVAIALCLTIMVAKVIGCTLPLLAKKIGFDPAVMASPIITTIVDAISLLLYFAIAQNFLRL